MSETVTGVAGQTRFEVVNVLRKGTALILVFVNGSPGVSVEEADESVSLSPLFRIGMCPDPEAWG